MIIIRNSRNVIMRRNVVRFYLKSLALRLDISQYNKKRAIKFKYYLDLGRYLMIYKG